MEQNKEKVVGEDAYEYEQIPKNIKLFGEVPEEEAVYFEDYVMTYLRRVFREKSDVIVMLVGKHGKKEAKNGLFVYGAFAMPLKCRNGNAEFEAGDWDQVYQRIHQFFSGAVLVGFSYAAPTWNSVQDEFVKQMQERFFSENGQVVLLFDLGDKEEKLFRSSSDGLKEEKGYYLFYAKNPLMQEFALRGKQRESFEANYADGVTANMREVIREKEQTKEVKGKYLSYACVCVALAGLVFAGSVLVNKSQRGEKAEKTMKQMGNVKENTDSQKVCSREKEQGEGGDKKIKIPSKKNNPSKQKKKRLQKEISKKIVPSVGEKPSDEKQKNVRKKTVTPTMEKKNQCYVVKEGDSLSQIVWRQYHSFKYMKEIKTINHIENKDSIYDGQCILLPPHKFK